MNETRPAVAQAKLGRRNRVRRALARIAMKETDMTESETATPFDPGEVALAEIIAELFAASEVVFEPGEGTDCRIEGDWLVFQLHKTGTIVGRVQRAELARRTAEVARRRT